MKIGDTCVGIVGHTECMCGLSGPKAHRQTTHCFSSSSVQATDGSGPRHGSVKCSDFLCVSSQREYTLLQRVGFCQGPLSVHHVAVRGIRQALGVLYFDQLSSVWFGLVPYLALAQ